ncbi:hypothetical protein D0C36_08895 [Mucilaginibacter conchicola]|uniref:Uncharacterized protein n=1 Tax=Mucilaginibacter conchicola TaxID=2303333 RepID=A0A372NZS0_9SPHI|nr:hypothetical protein [Mucilaginibacter conchicola]RFZ95616.1 hypothetical protein D0C36_08895 [Mucilaginibacter conchicola]
MSINNNYFKLFTLACGLLATVSACKKDQQTPVKEVAINLPSDMVLTYGQETDIALPADLISQADLSFKLQFDETENTQISAGTKLYDQLAKAVTIDKSKGKIHVDSRLLYPNGATSSANGKTIPDIYKITVVANSTAGTLEGKQTFSLKIAPARITIKGIDDKNETPYAYVLYNDNGASFELQAESIPTNGTTWHLNMDSKFSSIIGLQGNQVQFRANAGDPEKKAEQGYDLTAELQKDGFTVASRPFRVIFIPQIKFFYGTYYPDLNLTILTNRLYIALSNGYKSAAPTLYPEKYRSTFSLVSVEKDGKPFDNKEGIISVDSTTGAVIVKQNETLTEGDYKMIIKAITTTGLEFQADLTLNMSEG